jgi:GNAT superfamily N-acetyltransferase
VTVYLDFVSVRFGERACVEDIAVAPEHRSNGNGKALIDAAKALAGDHGAAWLKLESSTARMMHIASMSASAQRAGRSSSDGRFSAAAGVSSHQVADEAAQGQFDRYAWLCVAFLA